MSSESKKDNEYPVEQELMIPHTDPIGLPSNANLITVVAHGVREGMELIQVPDNVYIISPCTDDLSWSRFYWLGSKEDQIKACNRLDYQDLGGASDDRCLVDQLTRLEKMLLYSNSSKLYEYYPVEQVRRMIHESKYDWGSAQNNSLLRNTSDKALQYEFTNLTAGTDMNRVFQKICGGGTNFKTGKCTRLCVNGPGTYVKNQSYSGSYQPSERVYGSKIRYFKNSTGENVEVILRGTLHKRKKEVDPEGYKKVEEAMAKASPELENKIIDRCSLASILFYYKNFGIEAFKNPNEPVIRKNRSEEEVNKQIKNYEPLIIFLGNPCRADPLLGIGDNTKIFLDFNDKKSNEHYNELQMEMRRWFNDISTRSGYSNVISINYLPETHTIRRLDGLKRDIKKHYSDQLSLMINNDENIHRPSALRTSTNITTDRVSVRGPNSHLYNDSREVLLESPCTRTRPRLNEYMTDVRSQKIRIKRNITSNVTARNEIYLCDQLKKIGITVGSRIAIVLKLSGSQESPELMDSSIANKRDDIIFTSREDGKINLVENYESIRNKYSYNYFIKNLNELIQKRNKIRNQTQRRRKKKSTRKKGQRFSYRDYVQWDCVIFTELRGIENNALVLGLNKFSKEFIKGTKEELNICLNAILKKYNIPNSSNIPKNTEYGNIGRQSESLYNMPPSILNYCYWYIDNVLTDTFTQQDKTIERRDAYKEVLSRNYRSRLYTGDSNIPNSFKAAEKDKEVRERKEFVPEDLSHQPDLYDFEAWKCNKYLKQEDGTWIPCNAINYYQEENCHKCNKYIWESPFITEEAKSYYSLRSSLRGSPEINFTEPTLEELKESGIDPDSIINEVQIYPIRELLQGLPTYQDNLIGVVQGERKRGGKRKIKKKKTRKRKKQKKKRKTKKRRR